MNQLSKDQAMLALKKGEKIRFHTWWWGKFIRLDRKNVIDEKGETFSTDEILTADSGWEVYNEAEHGAHREQK